MYNCNYYYYYTEIQIRVDRRTTLAQLKEKLVSLIGVPATGFKVYRVYNNNQEYEMERLGDSLMAIRSESKVLVIVCFDSPLSLPPSPFPSFLSLPLSPFLFLSPSLPPSLSQFVVRLCRALQMGEHRIKVFLLHINNTEVSVCALLLSTN